MDRKALAKLGNELVASGRELLVKASVCKFTVDKEECSYWADLDSGQFEISTKSILRLVGKSPKTHHLYRKFVAPHTPMECEPDSSFDLEWAHGAKFMTLPIYQTEG